MMKIFLLINLVVFKILSISPPDLEISDLSQVQQSKVLYPCRNKAYHFMVHEDENQLEFFKETVASVLLKNENLSIQTSDEDFYQDSYGPYVNYPMNESSYKIYVFPSHQIYVYWNAKDDVKPEYLHNFKQRVFDVQLFPTTAQWIWSFLSYYWNKPPVKVNTEKKEDGHLIRISNNFRDERSQNIIELLLNPALDYVGQKNKTKDIRYLVKPVGFDLKVLSVQSDKCAYPKKLEEVKVFK